jgi:hypothetical protein
VTPRPPTVRVCDLCGQQPRAQHYTGVVDDRELHYCHGCWRWTVLAALDTTNIPEQEEED